jgi:hypothetical protein
MQDVIFLAVTIFFFVISLRLCGFLRASALRPI